MQPVVPVLDDPDRLVDELAQLVKGARSPKRVELLLELRADRVGLLAEIVGRKGAAPTASFSASAAGENRRRRDCHEGYSAVHPVSPSFVPS